MKPDGEYRPVACELYDRIEAFASMHRKVTIELKETGEDIAPVSGIIADIENDGKAEWLVMEDASRIRLDLIRSINGWSYSRPHHLHGPLAWRIFTVPHRTGCHEDRSQHRPGILPGDPHRPS